MSTFPAEALEALLIGGSAPCPVSAQVIEGGHRLFTSWAIWRHCPRPETLAVALTPPPQHISNGNLAVGQKGKFRPSKNICFPFLGRVTFLVSSLTGMLERRVP